MNVTIYTDGGCQGNPGPGAWACVLLSGEHQKELVGTEPHTTNNRMEVLAVVNALKALRVSSQVTLYSDSRYVVNAISRNWIRHWQRTGWLTANRTPVKNRELLEELALLLLKHQVTAVHVYGHNGNHWNEHCDTLCRTAMEGRYANH